jgi:phage shock protein A
MKSLLCIFVVISALGCSPKAPMSVSKRPDLVEVKKNEASAPTLKVFAKDTLKNLRLASLTLFLWNDENSDEERAEALRQVREYDKVEEAAMEYGLTLESLAQVTNSLDQVMEELTQLEESLKTLKQSENPDQTQVQDLTKKIQAKNQEVPVLQQQQAVLQARSQEVVNKFGSEEQMMKAFEGMPEKIAYLQKVTEWFDMDSASVSFKLKDILALDGKSKSMVTIEMLGIKFPGAKLGNYSTLEGTISDVKYVENGGTMEFVVKTTSQDLFFFKIHRSSYDDRAGRIIFKGEITYNQMDEAGNIIRVRRGQAKMVDRAN